MPEAPGLDELELATQVPAPMEPLFLRLAESLRVPRVPPVASRPTAPR